MEKNSLIDVIKNGALTKEYNLNDTQIFINPNKFCDNKTIYVICSYEMSEIIKAGMIKKEE